MAKTIKVGVIVFDGAEELDFAGLWDVLGAANRFSEKRHFELRSVSLKDGPVVCAHGLKVVPDEKLEDLNRFDVIAVPGGGYLKGSGGVHDAVKVKDLLEKLAEAARSRKTVVSVCTGAYILARAGLLRKRRATTHHMAMPDLTKWDPEVQPTKEKVVQDEHIVTAGGVSSSIDAGLKLVEMYLGPAVAEKVKRYLEYGG